MGTSSIRDAMAADALVLAEMKTRFVRRIYRGFLPMELFTEACCDRYAPEISQWLTDGRFQAPVLEADGQPQAFALVGDYYEVAGTGLIYEMIIDQGCRMEDYRRLLTHILKRFREAGYPAAYVWVLRDNFKVRYFYEQMGFRADGTRRTVQQGDQELIITRYVRPLDKPLP